MGKKNSQAYMFPSWYGLLWDLVKVPNGFQYNRPTLQGTYQISWGYGCRVYIGVLKPCFSKCFKLLMWIGPWEHTTLLFPSALQTFLCFSAHCVGLMAHSLNVLIQSHHSITFQKHQAAEKALIHYLSRNRGNYSLQCPLRPICVLLCMKREQKT